MHSLSLLLYIVAGLLSLTSYLIDQDGAVSHRWGRVAAAPAHDAFDDNEGSGSLFGTLYDGDAAPVTERRRSSVVQLTAEERLKYGFPASDRETTEDNEEGGDDEEEGPSGMELLAAVSCCSTSEPPPATTDDASLPPLGRSASENDKGKGKGKGKETRNPEADEKKPSVSPKPRRSARPGTGRRKSEGQVSAAAKTKTTGKAGKKRQSRKSCSDLYQPSQLQHDAWRYIFNSAHHQGNATLMLGVLKQISSEEVIKAWLEKSHLVDVRRLKDPLYLRQWLQERETFRSTEGWSPLHFIQDASVLTWLLQQRDLTDKVKWLWEEAFTPLPATHPRADAWLSPFYHALRQDAPTDLLLALLDARDAISANEAYVLMVYDRWDMIHPVSVVFGRAVIQEQARQFLVNDLVSVAHEEQHAESMLDALLPYMEAPERDALLKLAVIFNRLAALQYLMVFGQPEGLQNHKMANDVFALAAYFEHVDILAWLSRQCALTSPVKRLRAAFAWTYAQDQARTQPLEELNLVDLEAETGSAPSLSMTVTSSSSSSSSSLASVMSAPLAANRASAQKHLVPSVFADLACLETIPQTFLHLAERFLRHAAALDRDDIPDHVYASALIAIQHLVLEGGETGHVIVMRTFAIAAARYNHAKWLLIAISEFAPQLFLQYLIYVDSAFLLALYHRHTSFAKRLVTSLPITLQVRRAGKFVSILRDANLKRGLDETAEDAESDNLRHILALLSSADDIHAENIDMMETPKDLDADAIYRMAYLYGRFFLNERFGPAPRNIHGWENL